MTDVSDCMAIERHGAQEDWLTHPRVFVPPSPSDVSRAFVAALRSTPNAVIVAPGPRHWELFVSLLEQSGAIGNLVSDAWHAALAIEHGCEWITDPTSANAL